MKQTILLLACLFTFAFAKAQSGLQFSQVKLLNLSFTSTGVANLSTVPTGKVWKLENVQESNTNAGTLASFTFRYNGSSIGVPIPYGTTTNTFMNSGNPIWWPAGTVIDVNSNASGTSLLYFSILEFDVVP